MVVTGFQPTKISTNVTGGSQHVGLHVQLVICSSKKLAKCCLILGMFRQIHWFGVIKKLALTATYFLLGVSLHSHHGMMQKNPSLLSLKVGVLPSRVHQIVIGIDPDQLVTKCLAVAQKPTWIFFWWVRGRDHVSTSISISIYIQCEAPQWCECWLTDSPQ